MGYMELVGQPPPLNEKKKKEKKGHKMTQKYRSVCLTSLLIEFNPWSSWKGGRKDPSLQLILWPSHSCDGTWTPAHRVHTQHNNHLTEVDRVGGYLDYWRNILKSN